MYRPPYFSQSLPGASCLEVSGGNHWRSCGERAKLMSWGFGMRVGLLQAWRNGFCSCWTTWPWYWVFQRAVVAPQTSTTRVAKSVSSLLPRSPSLSAEGLRQKITRPTSHLVRSATVQTCITMLTNAGRLQRSQPLTRSYLPSSQPKPHELPVKKRKLESVRESAPALVLPTKVEEGWKQARRRREERGRVRTRAHAPAASLACQHPLFGESSFLVQNRVTAATVQCYTATLNEFLAFSRTSMDEPKPPAKLDEMVVEMQEHTYFPGCGHGAGDYLMAAVKFVGWIQSFSDLHRAVRVLKGYRRLAPGMSRGTLSHG